LNIIVYRYAQSNRINNNIKPSAEEIHRLGELFTTKIYKFLQPAFKSWIHSLEDLYPKTIPFNYGRIGDTPFSHLGITKNDWISPHKNRSDTSMRFIMWFTKGKFPYFL